MQPRHRWLGVAAGLLAAGLICGDAQAQVALTGVVSAADEGPMEGVLVSAKKEGSTITTTVVSDQQGAFSFPSARLEPGKYTISIRAIATGSTAPRPSTSRRAARARPTSS
jgi:virginiamycin B lyase